MSLTNTDEGNLQPPTGGTESPTSLPLGSEGQPLPDAIRLVLSRLDDQDKLIRGLQKGTDKQIGQVRNDVKRILELKEQGTNESQIQRELMLDSLLDQNPSFSEPVGKQVPAEPDLDVESTLKAMQFEESDIALAALTALYADNKPALVRAAANLRLQQLAVKPAGAAGALPPQGGSAPASQPNQAVIISEYEQKLKTIRRGDTMAVSKLKAETREKARKAGFLLNI